MCVNDLYKGRKWYIHMEKCVCTHRYMCVIVRMCVCIYFIVNLGKAVLGKIMMYFIPDKRILSTSCQALEA